MDKIEEKRVKMCIELGEDVVTWIRARAKKSLRAVCREVEMVLLDAKRRDEAGSAAGV